MDVTLLYFDDCPSWRQADEHLVALTQQIPHLRIHRQPIDTPEAAEVHAFRGSPSIHVDGVDIFAQGDEPVGLSCRIYQTPTGPAGSPSREQLRAALLGMPVRQDSNE